MSNLQDLENALSKKLEKLRKDFLGEYFRLKTESIFQEFQQLEPTDYDQLTNLKYKLDSMNELQQDIQTYIDNAKLTQ